MGETAVITYDVVAYDYKDERWIRRRVFNALDLDGLYKNAELLEKKYGRKLFFFPKGHKPEDHPEILKMHSIAMKHVQSFHFDYYIHDIKDYLRSSKDVVWLLRNTGTDIIDLKEIKKEDHAYHKQLIGVNDFFYSIKNGVIKKMTRESVLKRVLQVAEVA